MFEGGGRIAGDYDSPYDYGERKKKKGFDIDGVQNAVSMAGMLPVVGTFADLGNAALYALRGKWLDAGLSAASSIPVAGDAIGGARIAGKALKQL